MIMLGVGAACLGLFLAFWFWHSPMRRKLTQPEIDRYLGAIERQVFLPEDDKPKVLARLRAWAEADDGRPFYMLNLMRYYPELQRFPGTPNFQGTPEQANELYEKKVRQLLFKRCGYPMLAGRTQGKSLMEVPPALDCWGRVLLVRYRNRRTFLSLLADPAYGPWEPYKIMAVELVLVPVSGGVVIPDLRLLVGGSLLFVFLVVGWILAFLGKS
jgi:hypothetical protein